jgi:hypothetical protein
MRAAALRCVEIGYTNLSMSDTVAAHTRREAKQERHMQSGNISPRGIAKLLQDGWLLLAAMVVLLVLGLTAKDLLPQNILSALLTTFR